MSFLYMRSPTLGVNLKLNCTSFQTMLYSDVITVQTKRMAQHFPVKAQHPSVTFDLVFRNEPEYEAFQRFVRAHQLAALRSWPQPEVVLWWPERDITNWTGIIKHIDAGGKRFNPAPRARLEVELVDSVYSKRTELASIAATFWTVAGYGSPSGILRLPSLAVEMAFEAMGIGTTFGGPTSVFGGPR